MMTSKLLSTTILFIALATVSSVAQITLPIYHGNNPIRPHKATSLIVGSEDPNASITYPVDVTFVFQNGTEQTQISHDGTYLFDPDPGLGDLLYAEIVDVQIPGPPGDFVEPISDWANVKAGLVPGFEPEPLGFWFIPIVIVINKG